MKIDVTEVENVEVVERWKYRRDAREAR